MYTIVYTALEEQLNVSVRDLRAHLKYFLDKVEQGEEIIIMRNSYKIAQLVPSKEVKAWLDERQTRQVGKLIKLADNQEVKFRRLGLYEDPESVRELHRRALEQAGAYVDRPDLDRDLDGPAFWYEQMNGEFWVGEQEGQLAAMGAFQWHLGTDAQSDEAELKRMRVAPELQGQGIGSQLLELLEERARRKGYRSMVLDVTSAPDQAPARHFYEKYGYREFRRQPAKAAKFDLIFCRKAL